MPKDKMPTNREAQILWILSEGDRYGLEIRDRFKEEFNTSIALATMYTLLDRMKKAGLIKTSQAPVSGKLRELVGDKRRTYFRTTAKGDAALEKWRETAKTWTGMISGLRPLVIWLSGGCSYAR